MEGSEKIYKVPDPVSGAAENLGGGNCGPGRPGIVGKSYCAARAVLGYKEKLQIFRHDKTEDND